MYCVINVIVDVLFYIFGLPSHLLNSSGSGLCCISSLTFLWDEKQPRGDIQYYLVIFGQALSGGGSVGLIGSGTKVSKTYSFNAKTYNHICIIH